MKKLKRLMVGIMLVVVLVGNCISVSAATCCNDLLTNDEIYAKELAYKELLFTHTEQHGSVTVVCNVYQNYYWVRYWCSICGGETVVTESEVVHIY